MTSRNCGSTDLLKQTAAAEHYEFEHHLRVLPRSPDIRLHSKFLVWPGLWNSRATNEDENFSRCLTQFSVISLKKYAGLQLMVPSMESHIRTKRLWDWVNALVELTVHEITHLSGCETCVNAFKLCVLAKRECVARQGGENLPKSA